MTTLSGSTAMAVVSFALSRGIAMVDIQNEIGVNCHELLQPEVRSPERVAPLLLKFLADRFPGEPITLEMARTAPFSFFGGIAEGVKFADNLRSVFEFLSENSKVIADRLELELVVAPTTVKWTSFHPMDAMDGGLTNEAAVALTFRMLTEFLGISDFLVGMELAHDAHSEVHTYVDFFNVPVVFNAPKTAMIIDPAKLEARVKHANVELFNHFTAFFSLSRKKEALSGEPRELIRLRAALKANARIGVFSAECIASSANMSLRSAQRLTAEYNISIQTLIEDFREAMAKQCLANKQSDITAIAHLLGYSDDRAFRRAFHRWTGQTPTDYRRALNKSG